LNFFQRVLLGLAAAIGLVVCLAIVATLLRRRRYRRDRLRWRRVAEQEANAPDSLHPVVDPQLCSGGQGCLKACPEGDLFGFVDDKAVFIDALRCVGHGKCAEACPTGAISLVFGSRERGVDLPETSPFFESGRAGV